MSRLVNVDVFGANIDPILDVRSPANCPFMMTFLCITEHYSIVTPGEEEHFRHILDFLARNMHDRGTLYVALPNMEFERGYLKGNFGYDVHKFA